jgi:hypothetical protein
MEKSSKKTGIRQEWLARMVLTVLVCALATSDVWAAPSEDASLKAIGDKLKSMIILAINTVVVVVAVVMIAIKGLGYAMKDSSERNEEDAKKLKAGLIRVGVGAAIALGAGNIGGFIVSSL